MIRDWAIVRDAARTASDAAEQTCDAYRDRRVQQEPAFTDRMLGSIERAMQGYHAKGVTWTAKTLTDRGRNSEESRHGADFAGVLSIQLPGFVVNKGFLAQAKLIEPRSWISNRDFDRMQEQCRKMLERSTASFLFLYSGESIQVVPAASVVSSSMRNPHELYSRSIARFYEEHFESFIGDLRINAATPAMLERLQHELDVRRLLYLEAHEG